MTTWLLRPAVSVVLVIVVQAWLLRSALCHPEAEPHDADSRVELNLTVEILEAVQAELLATNTCKGGEEIDIWIKHADREPGVVDLIYRVPNVLHIFREAYIQKDRTVILADSLEFGQWNTRYSIHRVSPNELAELAHYPTHISSRLATSLNERQEKLHALREKHRYDALWRP